MNKIYYIIILIATMWDVSWCYNKIGEPCAEGDVTGTCKIITSCPYQLAKVQLGEKPNMCFYEDRDIITCCPINQTRAFPVKYKSLFNINNLVLKSDEMTCYYQQMQTILCCENEKPKVVPAEPRGCPMLPIPRLTDNKGEDITVQHPAWLKCVEYQRYFNVCVTNPGGSHPKYIRQNACGISKNSARVIGGQLARDGEFPHMAVIGRPDEHNIKDIEWTGGGSLLNEKFVLTAAHVLINSGSKPTYVLLGTTNKNDLKNGMLYNIIRQIIHDEYKQEKLNDIALVELHQSVIFNEFIRPACLPVPGRELKDDGMLVAGWGKTELGRSSNELLYATVSPSPRCVRAYGNVFNSERMLCAFGAKMEDTCQGDSGGPLMKFYTNLNCSYSIEGVVSYGDDCGKAGGIYTKVSFYLDWIMKYVWNREYNDYLELMQKLQNGEDDEENEIIFGTI